MNTAALSRIDPFPYRHRVAEVMSAPPVTVLPDMRLDEAARLLIARRVSSLIIVESGGAPIGIVTERDMLRAVARDGEAARTAPLGQIMSQPVHTVSADSFVYVAMGRMTRLNVRHLAVVDGKARLLGVITARALLKLRSGSALRLGDVVVTARDAGELGQAVAELPALARQLLAEGLSSRGIAAIIAGVMRDVTARATELAEAALLSDGKGAPPAPYALLVLGSAGRGESLLAPDQDNALVYDGSPEQDGWFAALGRAVADLLNAAGIPYCKGGVMASQPGWRRAFAGWERAIAAWVDKAAPEDLLNVDIFYDFAAVHGERGLTDRLRACGLDYAARSRSFLRLLAAQVDDAAPPIGLFGGLRTEGGRIDLKRGGLFPLVAGARVIALKLGIGATSTADRLAAAHEAGILGADDAAALDAAQETLLGAILRQQLIDIERGLPPTNTVEVARLSRAERGNLKEALVRAGTIRLAVQDTLMSEKRGL